MNTFNTTLPNQPVFCLNTGKQQTLEIQKGAIGVFDSGIGGLSIAKCIAKTLPNEDILYFSDSLFAPYGDKSPTEIIQRVNELSDKLLTLGVKALVVACNTATVNAIEQLRQRYKKGASENNAFTPPSLPIIGVEPAVKPATQLSKNKKVAVLATEATSRNARFIDLVKLHKNNCQVTIQPCPGLVEVIEANNMDSATCDALLAQYINPLVEQGIDTLVLGCTHYPFLTNQIKSIVGSHINIMETAKPVTEQLVRQLKQFDLLQPSSKQGQHYYLCSNPSEASIQFISSFWKQATRNNL